MNSKTLLAAIAGLVLTIGGAGVASAQTFDQTHPRRAEVDQRLETQNRRIDRKVATGEISPMKAHRLHRADRRIRMAERRDARAHDGHITKVEQARLNHRETRVSHRIG
jgi:hypothetical protein